MSKIVLDSVVSGYDLSKVNSNFQKIQAELNEKVLYRDAPLGEPNTLEKDIDANGFSILNLRSISLEGYEDLATLVEEAVAARDEAVAAKDIAVAIEDDFTDVYLGNKTADPVLDNDGNVLVEGSFYFNTVLSPKRLRVFDGVGWADAAAYSTNIVNAIDETLYASQAEAEAGLNDVKVMTPLRVKQSILTNAATLAQGALADSALQADDVGTSAGKIVALDGAGKLPAVDGSQLLGILVAPVGSLIMHAASTAPTGYLKANGAAISRSTYSALFSVIGTTYGAGDGSTTFNLPDFRGYHPRAWDDGRGIDTGRVFGSTQTDQYINHSHTASISTEGAHTHIQTAIQLSEGASALTGSQYVGPTSAISVNAASTASSGSHTHNVSVNTSTTGGSENRVKTLAILFCIKY